MGSFESRDGITILEVRELLAKSNATLERDKAYTCRRFIVNIKNGDLFYIRYIPTMGEMFQEIKDKGVLKFCKEHEAATDGKTPKARKAVKEKSTAVRTLKKVRKRVDIPKIAELQAKHVEMVLERMKIGNTPERKKELGIKLKKIREEIVELGGTFDIGGDTAKKTAHMSKEDMNIAAAYGIAKAAEKKAARGQNNKMATLKPNSAKAKKPKNYEDFVENDGEEDIEEESPKPKKKKEKVVAKPKAKAKVKKETKVKKEKPKKGK